MIDEPVVADSQSLVGRSYPPVASYQVSREKISEFARAIGDPNPVYFDPAVARRLGHPDVPAPPTFAVVLTLALSMKILDEPDASWDRARVVHRDQSFDYVRPIYAGDVLEVEVHVESVRSMAGNDVVTTRAEVRTEAREPVVDVLSVLVVRAVHPDPADDDMVTA